MPEDIENRGNGQDSAVQDPKHNVANRNKQIENALSETYKLDCQIKALVEKHIQPLRDAKSDIKKHLREDLSMPAKVFNIRYKAYQLEADAIANEDDITMQAIQELFEISPPGTQINMLDALGDGEGDGGSAGQSAGA